jgi:hypothetical protein
VRLSLLLLVFLFARASDLSGQRVRLVDPPAEPALAVLAEILARNDYLLVQRDTILPAPTHLVRDVVVLESRLSVEGRVDGAVAVIRGDLFVRPNGFVAGPIAVLDGAAFVSRQGFAGDTLNLPPTVQLQVERDAEGIAIAFTAPARGPALRLPNLAGAGLPTYDRVNALSLSWGAEMSFGGDPPPATVRGTIAYRSARRHLDGGIAVNLAAGQRLILSARAETGTRTTDAWIRGALTNSLSALLFGSDVRDYFHSDELSLALRVLPPRSLVAGEGYIAPMVAVRASRDRSLRAVEAWALFQRRDAWRPNPPIDEGRLVSGVFGATGGWRWPTSRFTAAASVEWTPPGFGEFDFAQVSGGGEATMLAILDHRLAVRGYGLATLGGREAPLQRWSFVGGPGTLPTYPVAAFRGDRLLFVNSVYLAPVPRLRLPLVGQPTLRLEHAIGSAWRTGNPRPPLEQNLGVGVQILIFHAMLQADPAAATFRPTFTFGAQLPGQGVGTPPPF